jgi:hypothetical protein
MLKLEDVERAGVFSRSPVQADELLRDSSEISPANPVRLIRRLVPLAAAAAVVAVALCGWMFGGGFAGRVGSGPVTDATPDSGSGKAGTIQACMAGPTQTLQPGCDAFDFDSDGSVTLADFGAYQLAYADVTR